MSRTIVRYDTEDIDLKDPVHGFLMGAVLVTMLSIPKESLKADEDPTLFFRKIIAGILNSASDQGISISKSEIPAAFLRPRTPLT